MGIIVVGGVVKKEDKYLLVQEANANCRGKWNLPAGRLLPKETIFDGTKREIFEECGYNVTLTGIAHIGNRVMSDNEFLCVIFSTDIVDGTINFNKNEILDVNWFSYKEIIEMHDELRSYDWITNAITAVENNDIGNLDIIRIIK